MTRRTPAAWVRVALVMFAVGWGANQFSPMLIVYRHSLGLGPGEIAGLFAIYAATLIPGLLAGGRLSDRFGRRACVLPFLGLAYGLCLVCGLHHAEQLAGPRDRGTVLAAYYVLAYLGFAAPYAVDGLNAAVGKPGTFAVLAGVAAVLAGLMWARAARSAPLHAPADTERRRLTPTPAP